jgi:oligopeptidase B
VPYWVPAKWVAKLRDVKADDHLLLLRMEGAGHGGAAGVSEGAGQMAFEWAFLLLALGVVDAHFATDATAWAATP